ncbi:MAG TPA: diguanylate cyclase [Solirubrobacteraceae bacterium]|nr:diguanylate cyclase [Solirubrobacteraceae bacterium]
MAESPALDAPVAGLGDAEALAKAWLLELIAARPLGEAARLPTERLAADGPALVAAVIGALVSDRELERLSPEGDLGGLAAAAGSIAGAGGPAEVVSALERLRSVVWAAIERTAPGPPPLHLAGRLARVCAKVAEAALAASGSRAATAEPPRDDELARIRVARTSEGPLWVEALERQLADGSRSGRRFALLLVDLDSAERVRLAGADEAAAAFAQIVRAVREYVRRADVVAHEDDGRVWVIAGDTGRGGANALALRIADAVEAAASLHGAALTVSVGIAVYPDDGREAAVLTGQAEEGMYAARAAGTRVDGGPEPDGPPQGGVRSGPWALG